MSQDRARVYVAAIGYEFKKKNLLVKKQVFLL